MKTASKYEDILRTTDTKEFLPEIVVDKKFLVLKSGSLLLSKPFGREVFHFGKFAVELIFTNPWSGKHDSFKTILRKVDEYNIQLECSNWHPFEPRTLPQPLELFMLGKTKIYFNFLVENLDKFPRITYKFYQYVLARFSKEMKKK